MAYGGWFHAVKTLIFATLTLFPRLAGGAQVGKQNIDETQSKKEYPILILS